VALTSAGIMTGRIALVLAGSGAKAAWQVGVLRAIAELLDAPRRSPFPIVCASSTGALNAALLATQAEDFAHGVERLHEFWRVLQPQRVFRGGSGQLWLAGLRLALAIAGSGRLGRPGHALFDLTPLSVWLAENVDFDRLEGAIDSHALHALAITCSGYSSGQTVTFFQGRPDIDPWKGTRRVGAHIKLASDHVLAALALPLLFPAVRIHREWFGDGTLRQPAPLSPALHLGAERILVIGCEGLRDEEERVSAEAPPATAQMLSHVLAGLYVDTLSADLERARRMNRLIAALGPEERAAMKLRPIEVLALTPNERLERRAIAHASALPAGARRMLASLGGLDTVGSGLLAQLLFAAPYTAELLEQGYRDALARRGELAQFFGLV